MNIEYCYVSCTIGKNAAKSYLGACESVLKAAFDFQYFTENCFKTCPYKQEHLKEKDKESI